MKLLPITSWTLLNASISGDEINVTSLPSAADVQVSVYDPGSPSPTMAPTTCDFNNKILSDLPWTSVLDVLTTTIANNNTPPFWAAYLLDSSHYLRCLSTSGFFNLTAASNTNTNNDLRDRKLIVDETCVGKDLSGLLSDMQIIKALQIGTQFAFDAADLNPIKVTLAGANNVQRIALLSAESFFLEAQISNLGCILKTSKAALANTIETDTKVDTVNGKVDEANKGIKEIIAGVDKANIGIDKANEEIDKANLKLDKILCPFGSTGLDIVVQGQGCDGIDQNCNGVVDECSEDLYPPTITLNRSLFPLPIFPSITNAIAFIDQNLVISDDCTLREQLSPSIQLIPLEGRPFDFQVQVTIADDRCGTSYQEILPATNLGVPPLILKIDQEKPQVTCGFFTPQNRFHVLGAFDPNSGVQPPFPPPGDQLHIDYCDFEKQMVDINFYYQIQDNFPSSLTVDITIKSNEVSERTSMVQVFENGNLPNMVHRAKIFLSPFTCHDSTIDRICETERVVSTRFYDLLIAATDKAGNVGETMCTVIVVPQAHYSSGMKSKKAAQSSTAIPKGSKTKFSECKRSKGKSTKGKGKSFHNPNDLRAEYAKSKQRYGIATFSHVWDPNLNTILTPPPSPIPPVPKSKKSQKFIVKSSSKSSALFQPRSNQTNSNLNATLIAPKVTSEKTNALPQKEVLGRRTLGGSNRRI